MNIRKKRLWSALALFFAAGLIALPATDAMSAESIMVGRIAFTEGQILRFVPSTNDWVATVKDAPFGIDDALYSDQAARGEFIMPNGIWVRIGGSTQLQLIAIKPDAGEMDVASGVARFYNKSSDAVLKVTTPFGYMLADPGSSFDLYVGDQSLEVIALDGAVDFIHKGATRYDVAPGAGSIIADAEAVEAGEGTVDAGWDDWNASRDNVWVKRVRVKGESVKYLPPQIQDDAYDLEENGTWEEVTYEGQTRNMWRPTRVQADWRPFSVGRWTEWYGDQCWVPDEPFGYVTHHYGNWVLVNGRWFWSPPVARVEVVAAAPVVEFGWYPGRVAWIGSGDDVGWVPLAPTEVYYSHRHWGPRAVVMGAGPAVSVNIGSLAFVSAAVVVPQASFYGVANYSSVRVTNINRTTIINHYHGAPVVNNTVIKNYNTMPHRHNFSNVNVVSKPHMEVKERIEKNRKLAVQQGPKVTAATLRQEGKTAKTVTASPPSAQKAKLAPPKVTNKIVPANQVNAPKNQVQFKPSELKTTTKPAPTSTPGMTKPGKPPQPPVTGTTQPSGVRPTAPGQTVPGKTLPGQTTPPGTTLRPGTTGKPGDTTPHVTPGAPGATIAPKPGHPPTPITQPGAPGATSPPTRPTRPTPPGVMPGTPRSLPPGQTTAPGVQPPRTTTPATPGAPGATIAPKPGHPPTPTTQPGAPGVTTPPTRPTRPTPPGVMPGTPRTLPPGQTTAPGGQPPRMTQPPATHPPRT
ncbi:MAG: DUF6600 domain-containing protein, partial [Syntrophobacteraceae bacterium]